VLTKLHVIDALRYLDRLREDAASGEPYAEALVAGLGWRDGDETGLDRLDETREALAELLEPGVRLVVET